MRLFSVSGQSGSGKDTVADYLVENHNFVKVALADPIKRFGMYVFHFDTVQLWGPSSARNAYDPRYTMCEIRSRGIKFTPQTKVSQIRQACDAGWCAAAERLLTYGPIWLPKVLPGCNIDLQMEGLCNWFTVLGHKYPELSPRIMLQHLGTEWGRNVADENIWIDLFNREALMLMAGFDYSRTEGTVTKLTSESKFGIVCSDVRFGNELQKIKEAGGFNIRINRPETDKLANSTGISAHPSETAQQAFQANQFDAIINNSGSLADLYNAVNVVVGTLML